MKIEKEIGNGEDSIYVYYNENDKKLAKLEGRTRWECKIGYSSSDPVDRILYQCPQEIRAKLPIIGLVIHSNNGYYIESKIHKAFSQYKMNFSNNDQLGDEWFMTNPTEIKNYYVNNILPKENKLTHIYEYEINDIKDLMLITDSHRKKLKLTHTNLAEKMNVNRITIHNSLTKKTGNLSLSNFFKMLNAMKLTLVIKSSLPKSNTP